MGIAFKRTDEKKRTACSAAQMFLDDGDGIVFLEEYGPWHSPESKQCHLSHFAAQRLLAGVLKTYEEQHGKTLREVFLHCRSTIEDVEWRGFQEARPKGLRLVEIRVAPDRRGAEGLSFGHLPCHCGSRFSTARQTLSKSPWISSA